VRFDGRAHSTRAFPLSVFEASFIAARQNTKPQMCWLKVKNRTYSQAEGRHELLTRGTI
jgi:hypothetical protein